MIFAFMAESSSRTALSVTARIMGDCLPMPVAAYSPAVKTSFKSSCGTGSGLYFLMLLRVSMFCIISFIFCASFWQFYQL